MTLFSLYFHVCLKCLYEFNKKRGLWRQTNLFQIPASSLTSCGVSFSAVDLPPSCSRCWRINDRMPLAGCLEENLQLPQGSPSLGTGQMSTEKDDAHKKGWGLRTAGSRGGSVGSGVVSGSFLIIQCPFTILSSQCVSKC